VADLTLLSLRQRLLIWERWEWEGPTLFQLQETRGEKEWWESQEFSKRKTVLLGALEEAAR
jgi:hypothetical protein